MKRRWFAAGLGLVAVLFAALWLARAYLAAQVARSYFRDHGVAADVQIGALGLSGVSGRFALGPSETPDIAAGRIELHFDPLHWIPTVVEVRLVNPVVRARVRDDGSIALGSLDSWLASLRRQTGKSRFVSDNLTIALTGLRAILETPAGRIEAGGDIKLVKNLPVTIALAVQPANLAWHGYAAKIARGSITYESTKGQAALQLAADVKAQGVDLQGLKLDASAASLRWTMEHGLVVTIPAANVTVTADRFNGLKAAAFKLAATNIAYTSTPMTARAELRFSGDIASGDAAPSLHTGDARLDRALIANLARLSLNGTGRIALAGSHADVELTAPLEIKGGQGGVIRVNRLKMVRAADALDGGLDVTIKGGGLPDVSIAASKLAWGRDGLASEVDVRASFDYAMLRKASMATRGTLTYNDGRYAFTPAACVVTRLAAFHPSASDLAKNVRADICGSGGPLFAGEGAAWKLRGTARNATAFLPLANSTISKTAAGLSFDGVGADFHGQAIVRQSDVQDQTSPVRFKPVHGTGTAVLERGAWRGRFAITAEKGQALGDVTFTHTMATGKGSAHIAATRLTFAADGLQPVDLTPMMAAFRRADGVVDFTGDIDWTRDGLTSRGTAAITKLDFLTPLGRAHTIQTRLDFISLLPPQTAPGQELTIARIDWTLPFSAVDLKFSFSPTQVKVDALASGWAEGRAALTPFTINLADPSKVAGTADIKSINLENVIAASNLNSKIRLQGKMSGTIPFTTGPEGLRITKGRIAADGPGRLSVNRSVWAQGDAAISSNAVQDFAYQAMENLAFENLSADLNSVANGRLQIVFHVKGKFDPPKPQTADVALTDIINGTALYKPIPLPSGTPVDLTLDASLNFDELLKSYSEAWSKTLSPEGQPDVSRPGAK